jgi:hypothetical protein
MKVDITAKELGFLQRRRAADIARDGRQKIAGPKLAARKRQPADDGGAAYMAWLHHDIPCIACLILGRSAHPKIEAAHQKLQMADRGWNRTAGRRGPHRTCVALCAGHHRLGKPCCDPAQTKFWALLGFTVERVIDFVEALNAAFDSDLPGAPVVREFARPRRA